MVLASIETFAVAYLIVAGIILLLAVITAQPMNDEPINNELGQEEDEETSTRKVS